jgi:hypothetical protein
LVALACRKSAKKQVIPYLWIPCFTLQIFKGFRLNSALDYTIFLRNKNAVQLSYLWDAYRTGGHHDNFEMAAHTLNFSLLFGLK